jgi:hypothetical protein
MGKKAKEHRKKVAKRNTLINESKKKQQKQAMDFLMKLIRKENASGAFDNPVQPLPEIENKPQNTNENFSGPQI